MRDKRNNKCTAILIAVIVTIAVVVFFITKTQYFKKNFPSNPAVIQDISDQDADLEVNGRPEKESVTPLEINFSTGGMVFDENRITGTKEWTFLYEEPGMLTLTVKMLFDENSVCDLDDGEQICDMSNFIWKNYDTDTYFDLDGYKEGGEVTVIKLKLHRY